MNPNFINWVNWVLGEGDGGVETAFLRETVHELGWGGEDSNLFVNLL